MNCSVCGAENASDARFCAECGAPLEPPAADEPAAGQPGAENFDDDMTIISSRPEPDAGVTSSAEEMAEPETPAPEAESGVTPAPEPPPPPAGDRPASALTGPMPSTPSDNQPPPAGVTGRNNRQIWLIVGLVILVLLLCCCCISLAVGGLIGSDPTLLDGLL